MDKSHCAGALFAKRLIGIVAHLRPQGAKRCHTVTITQLSMENDQIQKAMLITQNSAFKATEA